MEMGKEKFLECSHGDYPLADNGLCNIFYFEIIH
jgi:hypothetical protein